MEIEIQDLYRAEQWEKCAKSLLAIDDPDEEEINLIGACHKKLGNNGDAEKYFKIAVERYDYEKSIFNLALLYEEKKPADALSLFERAVAKDSLNSQYLFKLGIAYERANRLDDSYNLLTGAVLLHPYDDLVVGAYIGSCRKNNKKAACLPVLERYLEKNPDNHLFLGMYAKELELTDKVVDSLKTYKKIAILQPDKAFPLLAIAKILFHKGLHNEVLRVLDVVIVLDEVLQNNKQSAIYESMFINAQRIFDVERTEAAYINYSKEPNVQVTNPFAFLCYEDESRLQLKRARNHAKKFQEFTEKHDYPRSDEVTDQKIKIGYIGGDFYNHAMMHLMTGVFRQYNNEKFEVHCFSVNSKTDERTQQIIKYSDYYHDISKMHAEERLEYVRNAGIKIALDIGGYTKDTDPQLFAARVAPIQINFLGYPATMGIPNMDYILGDKWVTPLSKQEHFSEQIIQMPNCYQPNDSLRSKELGILTKEECGLPKDQFVFACFNQIYKIQPNDVQKWSQILIQCPNSVIWLLSDIETVKINIRSEFAKYNISESRIVFAGRQKLIKHLSRHEHIDVFLDTSIYNAHTTGSDALWYGVPLVTQPGQTFAARVGASLLEAVDLPDLICLTDQEYIEKAVKLYKDCDYQAELKERLGRFNTELSLFNTSKWVEDYEGILEKLVGR